MEYRLSEIDVRVIKSSLEAHLKQCESSLKNDDKVGNFTVLQRCGIEEKIRIMKELLDNM